MADEKKKISGGVIAAICAAVVAIIVVVVVVVLNLNKGGVVGKYTLDSIVTADGTESSASAASGVMQYTLELKDDKTGTMVMKTDMSQYSEYYTGDNPESLKSEITSEITYDDKKMKITTNGVEAEADYEYKDGILTMEIQNQKMKFKKA